MSFYVTLYFYISHFSRARPFRKRISILCELAIFIIIIGLLSRGGGGRERKVKIVRTMISGVAFAFPPTALDTALQPLQMPLDFVTFREAISQKYHESLTKRASQHLNGLFEIQRCISNVN